MAARGRGLFSLCICIENFKNLLVRNHWTDFHMILQKCSFGDPVARLFKPFGFVKKHGRQVGGAYFPYISLWKTLKIFLSETTGPISIWFCRNVPLVILLQDCSSRHDSLKTWPLWGGVNFPHIENFKNLLVINDWTDFNITWQKCFISDPLSRLFKPIWFVKKHGR